MDEAQAGEFLQQLNGIPILILFLCTAPRASVALFYKQRIEQAQIKRGK